MRPRNARQTFWQSRDQYRSPVLFGGVQALNRPKIWSAYSRARCLWPFCRRTEKQPAGAAPFGDISMDGGNSLRYFNRIADQIFEDLYQMHELHLEARERPRMITAPLRE